MSDRNSGTMSMAGTLASPGTVMTSGTLTPTNTLTASGITLTPAVISAQKPGTAETVGDFGPTLPAPDLPAYGLTAALDHLKAWFRREIAMHAAGLSHAEREKQNP